MHIGFLTPEYPHDNLSRSGGLGTSIKNLAIELVRVGVKATVFIIGQKESKEFLDEGVVIVCLEKKIHKSFNWYFERKRLEKILNVELSIRQIDLLEGPDWTGLSAFMSFKVPFIIRMHGSDGYFCHLEGRKQKWKNKILERRALSKADALLSVSTFTGTITKNLFHLKKEITTIYNSIDTEQFKPSSVLGNKNLILYYGTLVRKKGVLELPYIFNRVIELNPNAKLLLLGKDNLDVFEGKPTWELFQDKLSEQSKLSVQYLSEIPYKEVKHYIEQSQVVVLPSYAEAFPMTWLETLAMEKPLVSSNIGWAKELMIDGLTGFTVNPRNHNHYADKIVALLRNPALCEQLGKAGRKHVERNFSTKKIIPQNIEFYERVIHQYT